MRSLAILVGLSCCALASQAATVPSAFFTKHCTECHDAATKKGNLGLTV